MLGSGHGLESWPHLYSIATPSYFLATRIEGVTYTDGVRLTQFGLERFVLARDTLHFWPFSLRGWSIR